MTKRALCVGINDYPGTGADLSGCVNDALDWEQFLLRRGYVVTTMTNGDATRGAVLSALTSLVEATGYRDTFVTTVSSHGTWRPDRNGDEADGRDECIVTADFGLISDDELAQVYGARRYGSRHVMVADLCHSGSVTRLVDFDPQPNGREARYLAPGFLLDVEQLKAAERVAASPARSLTSSSDVLLLSGCKDAEVSWDAWFGTRPNGAFSRALLDTLAAMPAGSTYRDVHAAIPLPSDDFDQTPQISGSYAQARWPAFA